MQRVDAICFLGLKSFDSSSARRWLQDNQRLYLVDDHPPEVPTEILQHPRVRYFEIETPLLYSQIAKEIAWGAVMQSLDIRIENGWEDLKEKIEECHHAAHLLLSEVADFGVKAFTNARANWKSGSFRHWQLLMDRFKDVPAIVCGAGPSLQDAQPYLANIGPRALILAAGTAAPILGEWGVEPHLALSIDKETPVELARRQPFHELTTVMQSRFNPDCAAILQGEKIVAPESGPLPWERWWVDETLPFSFGWTVGNFATKIAIWMGCNPIIWAGMDFSYPANQKYAGSEIETDQRMTQRDFLLAARYSEETALNHPHIRFIQTSNQGLPLKEPIETRPFAFAQQLLKNEFDLRGRLHQAIQCSNPMNLEMQSKENEWNESIRRCSGNLALDLTNEIVYQHYLEPLWQIWRPIFVREADGQSIDLHRSLFFQTVLQNIDL